MSLNTYWRRRILRVSEIKTEMGCLLKVISDMMNVIVNLRGWSSSRRLPGFSLEVYPARHNHRRRWIWLYCYMVIAQAILFTVFPPPLNAQPDADRKYAIDIHFGRGTTGLYHRPADLYDHNDGNPEPEVQENEYGSVLNLSLARKIAPWQAVGLTLGFTQYRYYESGTSVNGWIPDTDYEKREAFRFVDVGLIHRFTLLAKGPNLLLLENALSLEYGAQPRNFKVFKPKLKNTYEFEGNNYQYRISLSYGHLLTEWAYLQAGVYFRTALNDYNEEARFAPYNLGVLFGAGGRF